MVEVDSIFDGGDYVLFARGKSDEAFLSWDGWREFSESLIPGYFDSGVVTASGFLFINGLFMRLAGDETCFVGFTVDDLVVYPTVRVGKFWVGWVGGSSLSLPLDFSVRVEGLHGSRVVLVHGERDDLMRLVHVFGELRDSGGDFGEVMGVCCDVANL